MSLATRSGVRALPAAQKWHFLHILGCYSHLVSKHGIGVQAINLKLPSNWTEFGCLFITISSVSLFNKKWVGSIVLLKSQRAFGISLWQETASVYSHLGSHAVFLMSFHCFSRYRFVSSSWTLVLFRSLKVKYTDVHAHWATIPSFLYLILTMIWLTITP